MYQVNGRWGGGGGGEKFEDAQGDQTGHDPSFPQPLKDTIIQHRQVLHVVGSTMTLIAIFKDVVIECFHHLEHSESIIINH